MATYSLDEIYGNENNPAYFKGSKTKRPVELVVYPNGTARYEYISSDVTPNSGAQLDKADERKVQIAKADERIHKQFDSKSWRDFLLTQAAGAAAGAGAVAMPYIGNGILAVGDKAAGYLLGKMAANPTTTALLKTGLKSYFGVEGLRNYFGDNGWNKTVREWDTYNNKFGAITSGLGDIMDLSMITPLFKSGKQIYNINKNIIEYFQPKKFSLVHNFKELKELNKSTNAGLTNRQLYNLAYRQTHTFNPLRWHNYIGERLRYTIGKNGKFKNSELPMMFRKYKHSEDGNFEIIIDNKGNIILNNPETRFAFDNGNGTKAYGINTTTDIDVRPHSNGDWENGHTIIFPMNTMFGKGLLSTRPSDSFTKFITNFEPLKASIKNSSITTGDKELIKQADNIGLKVNTNATIQKLYEDKMFETLENTIEKQNNIAKAKAEGRIALKKQKETDWTNYGQTIRNLNRNNYRNPTINDYKFADYVFDPVFRSEVITSDILKNPKLASSEYIKMYSDADLRRYFENYNDWGKVIYHPFTNAESLYRKLFNINEIE